MVMMVMVEMEMMMGECGDDSMYSVVLMEHGFFRGVSCITFIFELRQWM
jgi:hypothetical protein